MNLGTLRLSLLSLSAALAAAMVAAVAALAVAPAAARAQAASVGASEEKPLPTEMVVIDIDAPENQAFRMGIVDFFGHGTHGPAAGGVLRNDFRLMPGYKVIDPRSITHDVAGEGLAVRPATWAQYQANGIIKGQIAAEGGANIRVDAKFFWLARGAEPALSKTYRGDAKELRAWMHDFANEVLFVMTGVRGSFGTKITFAERKAPGQKDVFCAQMDGTNVLQISRGKGVSMLPSFEPSGHVWFTKLMESGSFITRSGMQGKPVITGSGLTMGPIVCENRIFFTSTRDGNSEIYSASMTGTDVKRVTNHPAIDTSPTCGPNGKLAFVSARHGGPQIFVMNQDGSDVKRVTYKGAHNQTPAWCTNGVNKNLIAFTGRDGTLDIFTVDIGTQEYTRLTQGQGMNKDPAFSPDCRMVAFVSDRRGAPGIYLSSTRGFGQTKIIAGAGETVRWHP
jgi:TolB protein